MQKFLFVFLLSACSLSAQSPFSAVCADPESQIDLNGNALRARILGAGDFGWDFSEGIYIPNFDPTSTDPEPGTIFLGGLWYGGIDAGGNLVLKATGYRSGGGSSSFFAGPLQPATGTTDQAVCENWDRHFFVTADNVGNFLADLADGTLSAPHIAVRGWPATGNPFFADVNGFDLPAGQPLASFHDEDNDGLYNPMAGDYPVVKLQGLDEFVPDLQLWQVTNDEGGGAVDPVTNGKPLHAEIQITYFVFSCPGNPLLNNAMFTSHKIINRAGTPVDSFSLAMFVDFDLGCYKDDYTGCDPSRNSFYAYNRTNTDQPTNCDGLPAFGLNPPVQAVTFLNRSMDRFIPIYGATVGTPPAATTDPQTPPEYFHYLHGHWRDGRPVSVGGSGYSTSPSAIPATHAFPGDPNQPAEWSMNSAAQPGRDQRALAIHELGTISPGQVIQLNTAWSYHRGDGLDHLENVSAMLAEVTNLRALYDNGFTDVCSTPVSTGSAVAETPMRIWPNPGQDRVYIRTPAGKGLLRVFDQAGRLKTEQAYGEATQLTLKTANWPNGVYFLAMSTVGGVVSGRVVIAH